MSKRVKILVSVVAAVLLLTAGIAIPVMAQEEPAPTTEVNDTGLLARVAEILGISEEDLINAFKQAQQEMREEAFNRMLDKAVAEGLLTQDEAEEIKEWWEQRPEVLDQGLLPGIRRGMQPQIRQRICQKLNEECPQPQIRQQWQEMRQQAWQQMNRAWHRLGPSSAN